MHNGRNKGQNGAHDDTLKLKKYRKYRLTLIININYMRIIWIPAWIPEYITEFQSSPVKIWKTVSNEWRTSSKFDLVWTSKVLNFPPKSCIPRRLKMTIKSPKSNKSEAIERIEFSNEATKFDKESQYFVTLKIR